MLYHSGLRSRKAVAHGDHPVQDESEVMMWTSGQQICVTNMQKQ